MARSSVAIAWRRVRRSNAGFARMTHTGWAVDASGGADGAGASTLGGAGCFGVRGASGSGRRSTTTYATTTATTSTGITVNASGSRNNVVSRTAVSGSRNTAVVMAAMPI